MTHHRCTGCKEESYPRHKWKGGVYCDDCIKAIRGYRRGGLLGFFGSIWDKVVTFVQEKIFRKKLSPRAQAKVVERQVLSRMKQVEQKARSIPVNPQSLNPQKR